MYDLESCASALGNTTAPVRTVNTDKMPPGCGYVDNPLLGGAVMYLNTRNDSSAYCDPPAVCLCLKLRREVEIGNNFLWMLVGLVGALLVLGIVIWFNYVRLSAYEREKKSHVAKTLAEQIGPGGAACLAALKPFGDTAVSMSWRFGATEADCVEEYHREHNSGGGVGGFLATRKAPDWYVTPPPPNFLPSPPGPFHPFSLLCTKHSTTLQEPRECRGFGHPTRAAGVSCGFGVQKPSWGDGGLIRSAGHSRPDGPYCVEGDRRVFTASGMDRSNRCPDAPSFPNSHRMPSWTSEATKNATLDPALSCCSLTRTVGSVSVSVFLLILL